MILVVLFSIMLLKDQFYSKITYKFANLLVIIFFAIPLTLYFCIIDLAKGLIETKQGNALKSSKVVENVFVVKITSSGYIKNLDLGAKFAFHDYIDEEFEDDDEEDWIKLKNSVSINLEGIPYSIFI